MTNTTTMPERKRTRSAHYPVTVSMGETELRELEEAAARAGLSRAKAVRQAVAAWVSNKPDQEKR